MPVEEILANYDYGISILEISERFRIAPDTIQDLLSYAERRHAVARPVR